MVRSHTHTVLQSDYTDYADCSHVKMSLKQKRAAFNLEQKNDIESGKKQTAIAATFGVAKTTVNTIWFDRDNIRRAYEESPAGSRKRMRTAAYEDIEAALLKWFQLARSQNIPISGQLMREKAALFPQKLKDESFQCSGGWLDRFKARHGVVFRGGATPRSTRMWKLAIIRQMMTSSLQ